MNSHTQQPATNYARVATLFMPFLIIAVCSTTVVAQRASFLVNNQHNPLKSFVVASKSESHPFFVDIDGDKDQDCFVGEYPNAGASRFSKVHFFRNEGNRTNPIFKQVGGTSNPLHKVLTNTLSIPYFVDIDADRDYDCFIGEGSTGALLYYKNEGTATQPSFKKQSAAFNPLSMVRFSASGVASPAFGDVDGDGDQDCVIADHAGLLNYFKNVGTANQPRFAHVTSSDNPFAAFGSIGGIYNLSFADWNKDGLVDVFINSTYYRNAGTKQKAKFTSGFDEKDAPLLQNTVAAKGTYTPFRLTDLNGDGIPEAFHGTSKGGFVFQTVSGNKAISIPKAATIGVLPNPSTSAFTVTLASTIGKTSTIRIMDVQGRILSTQTMNSSMIKVGASLKPGVYILQVLQNNKAVHEQKLIKK